MLIAAIDILVNNHSSDELPFYSSCEQMVEHHTFIPWQFGRLAQHSKPIPTSTTPYIAKLFSDISEK